MSGHTKILVTDTNQNVLRTLQSVLAENGYEVHMASTTAEFLFSLKCHCFDLIILDVTLPELKVLEVIDSILTSNLNTAIISTNDAVNFDLAIETVRRGAFDLLVKPYDSAVLLKTIELALNNSAQIVQDKSISAEVEIVDDIYHFMIENSQDIQYLLDHDGNFTFINKRVETLLGFKRSELIGKPYTEIVYSDDLPKAAFRLHDKRSNTHSPQSVELRFKSKNNNGIPLYFEIESIPIPGGMQTLVKNTSAEYQNPLADTATFGIAHDVSARKKIELIVNKKASYDHLTSLPNNILFHDRLTLAIAKAKRAESIFAVMYLDLDGFKAINDIYGHHIGDKVLKVMSARMQSCLRESDTLARVGGDEFTLLLTQVSNIQEASIIASKLTAAVSKPFSINKNNHFLSVSIGIAFYPENGETREALIDVADKAMYHIKNGNKNGYKFVSA